jgi:5-methylcytosine-specific restriction endonuclease McrA
MKNYVKTYLKYFGFSPADFIPCEACGAKSVEIHHLRPKSLDKKLENNIGNLIALCRLCHEAAHRDRKFNEELKLTHRRKLLADKEPAPIVKYSIEKTI